VAMFTVLNFNVDTKRKNKNKCLEFASYIPRL